MRKIDFNKQTWTSHDFKNLDDHLISIADKKYRDFSKKLVPKSDRLLGVRIPELREMAKEIARGNWELFIKGIGENYFETVMLHGLVLGYAKTDCKKRLGYLSDFVPKIDNWSVCDSTCSSLKFVKSNRAEVLEFINKYLESHKEFELRFAVVLLMDYYITDEYIDMVLDVLAKVNHDGYYVKMAVAWAVSVCFVKYQDKTFELLKSGKLDADTYKKALQKIVESNRVDKETKAQIYYLKNM